MGRIITICQLGGKAKRDKKLDKQYLKLLKEARKLGVGEKELLEKKIKKHKENKMANEYKTIIRKKDFSTMILLCTTCYHEIEVVKDEGQPCDWCGGNMVIVGQGMTWPLPQDYKIIIKKIKNNNVA